MVSKWRGRMCFVPFEIYVSTKHVEKLDNLQQYCHNLGNNPHGKLNNISGIVQFCISYALYVLHC